MSDDPVPIVHRDARYLIVHKPSGVASHRGWSTDARPLLQRARDTIGQLVYLAHRLDKPTSGLVLLTLDPEACTFVQKAFEAGDVEKRYLALCRGRPKEDAFTVDRSVRKTDKRGPDVPRLPACTDFSVLARANLARASLIEARPRTGRLHQIRRHLMHVDHPIVGDKRYGDRHVNREHHERFGLGRLALHAFGLDVPHPDGGRVRAAAAPDGELGEALAALELAEASTRAIDAFTPLSASPPRSAS